MLFPLRDFLQSEKYSMAVLRPCLSMSAVPRPGVTSTLKQLSSSHWDLLRYGGAQAYLRFFGVFSANTALVR